MNPHDPALHDVSDASAALDMHPARTFLGQWLRDPLKVASVTPSGQQLAHLMIGQLPRGCRRVVELGAGTGVFTRAMLDAGVALSRVLVVEINPHLAEFLRNRFPGLTVACADARELDTLARQHGFCSDDDKPDAVISGLGMLSMSSKSRCDILRAAFATMHADGRLIQFTYGAMSPVRRRECETLNLTVRRAGFALRNLPPATVYVYQRRALQGTAGDAIGSAR